MAKAAFTKKMSLSATGIIHIDGDYTGIENLDTGEMVDFSKLFEDFSDKIVKIGVSYDEDYVPGADE